MHAASTVFGSRVKFAESKNLCTCQFQALTVLYSINAEGHRVEISFNEIPPRIEINPQPQRLLITPQVDKTTCA